MTLLKVLTLILAFRRFVGILLGKKFLAAREKVILCRFVNTTEIVKELSAVNKDSCRRDFDGVSVGSSCEAEEYGKHCVFDEFTRKGECSGVKFVTLQ